jgi:TolA-binding protein
MSAKKKHYAKKEIKEDPLVNYFFEAREFWQKYQKQILIGVSALVVLVVVVILFQNKAEKNRREASAKLAAIVENYNLFDFNKALYGDSLHAKDGLIKIVEEYGSTTPGEIAKLFAGNSFYALTKYDEANKYYGDCGLSAPLFSAASDAGQAACYEAQGATDDAAQFYEIAEKEGKYNPNNAEYLLKAAINYIDAGKYERAEEMLNKIKSDYPKAKIAREVDRYFGKIAAKKALG